MKNFILIVTIFIISFGAAQAQPKKMTEELKKIRKQKYLESVTIDDATADKYFDIYDANFESIMKLNKQKRDDMEYIEKNTDASDVTAKLEEILDLDGKILDKKKELYSQIKTLLTPKQLAQSVIFQMKFNKELKKQIDKRKKGKRPDGER
ncbi:MAG: hypothetical protein JST55_03270 [Bacteroidetes bacterium]|nr:hypothetical protein [Bacteroidota bacterium]